MKYFAPADLRALVKAHVPGFDALPPGERVLQCMAYLSDALKVREVGGNNRGPWVESFLHNLGLGPGYSWCAACLAFCADAARVTRPDTGAAGCHNWVAWAKKKGLWTSIPARCVACVHDSGGGSGHIGMVKGTLPGLIQSIEGNTSSGITGSQTNGDGVYRRTRTKGFWGLGYIRFEDI